MERQTLDAYPESLPLEIQKEVRERLCADPYFAERRVRILIQDDGEINDLIARKTLPLRDPLLLISLSEIEANAPSAIFHFDLAVLELPLANRSRAGFDTALGIAWHAARLLDGETFHFDRIVSQLNDDGTFQSVASFRY